MTYYIDPKTDDLIIYDPKEEEIRVAKSIGEETTYEEVEEKKEELEEPEGPRKHRKKEPGKSKVRKGRQYKIDDKKIEKIKEMRKDGVPMLKIVAELGVSAMTVYKYSKGIAPRVVRRGKTESNFEEEEDMEEEEEEKEEDPEEEGLD